MKKLTLFLVDILFPHKCRIGLYDNHLGVGVFLLPRLGLENSASASSQLPRPPATYLGLEHSASVLPRPPATASALPRQYCLGLGLVKTASPTSLVLVAVIFK